MIDPVLQEALLKEKLLSVGIVDADTAVTEEEREDFRQWLAEGRHGTMQWLEKYQSLRFEPRELLSGCRSIIFVALNYYQHYQKTSAEQEPSGRVARYAWGRDYHKELGKRIRRVARSLEELFPGEQFRSWTDATPLAERYFAERAGIGFTGRHTLLINHQYGSWFVLGEILSTHPFPASEPARGRHGVCPSRCVRCIDVCPTGALPAPHRIDATRCISYLTIEYDGIIPEDLRPRMGEWIFGCDLCQEVCPLNVRARTTDVEGFLRPIAGDSLLLRKILAIRDEEEFRLMFAGSPLMRARRRRLVRNACIVAANIGARELAPQIRECARDIDPIIAEHGRWALKRLESTDE